jgi:hypothetical protein
LVVVIQKIEGIADIERPDLSRRIHGAAALAWVLKIIQAICNGKTTPSAMQRLAWTREKQPAQEQWVSMEKQ